MYKREGTRDRALLGDDWEGGAKGHEALVEKGFEHLSRLKQDSGHIGEVGLTSRSKKSHFAGLKRRATKNNCTGWKAGGGKEIPR